MRSRFGHKIGKSSNPEKRLQQLKTANPDIRLISYGDQISESELHEKFKYQRLKGEWFKLSTKDVEYILRKLKTNEIQSDSNSYEKKLNYEIKFGKHKGKLLNMMTSWEEISYIKWYLKASTDKKTTVYKYFKWWLTQI
jgi:hypothetical protein